MSKKYKGKVCVYCANRLATTADHVIARQFFDIKRRSGLPKVPSCAECNNTKSKLEHYLISVLPFGSNHDSAQEMMGSTVERRLSKNIKLKKHLQLQKTKKWAMSERGLYTHNLHIPINNKAIIRLFEYIAQGLLYTHYNVILGPEYFMNALTITDVGYYKYYDQFVGDSKVGIAKGNLAENGFTYTGRQGKEYPEMSVWFMQLYDGIKLVGENSEISNQVFAVSGHKRILRNAYLAHKYGIYT
ncbi:MAG: hypothetical protein N0E44_19075 [Candidatus Thiodiazotropha lotti]|nr:hypothetical protein [Candidatus Thiodiazotropha lotti]MCW4221989.1 hypothetical protein [Candidatus Thiodiazotropha lotti]